MTLIKMTGPGGDRVGWLENQFGARIANLFRAIPPAVMEAFKAVIAEKDEQIRQQEAEIADLQGDVKDLTSLRGITALLVRRMGGNVSFRQGELREVAVGSVLAVAKTGKGDGPAVEMVLSLRAPDAKPASVDLRPGS